MKRKKDKIELFKSLRDLGCAIKQTVTINGKEIVNEVNRGNEKDKGFVKKG